MSYHTFFIPVMGTGFTVDAPLKVAQYGIDSVISLVDDILIENIHRHYLDLEKISFTKIKPGTKDARAQRITRYLNYVNETVNRQIASMKKEISSAVSGLTRYFKMLPECIEKKLFEQYQNAAGSVKAKLFEEICAKLKPGVIDVNIMTKLDVNQSIEPANNEFTDAKLALKGFALSDVDASVVLSAGMNPSLFAYMTGFKDFYPDKNGHCKKRIILKVSDFRSAKVQGMYLAKKGLWVSEFRVESGINCGGHAFPAEGILSGPILSEFSQNIELLTSAMAEKYFQALERDSVPLYGFVPSVKLTYQGGLGSSEEHNFLLREYSLSEAGWGSPFLMVPDVVTLDETTRSALLNVQENDIQLSAASPLGTPYWNLLTTESEAERVRLIKEGAPGSPCPKGFLKVLTDKNGKPVCPASNDFFRNADAHEKEKNLMRSCICHDLSGCIARVLNLPGTQNPAICPGPNVINFKKNFSLEEMIDHIYGRGTYRLPAGRPHFFIHEINLYMDYYFFSGIFTHSDKVKNNAVENIEKGIHYYKETFGDSFVPAEIFEKLEKIKKIAGKSLICQ